MVIGEFDSGFSLGGPSARSCETCRIALWLVEAPGAVSPVTARLTAKVTNPLKRKRKRAISMAPNANALQSALPFSSPGKFSWGCAARCSPPIQSHWALCRACFGRANESQFCLRPPEKENDTGPAGSKGADGRKKGCGKC